ncbi:hypothetical protein E2C01_059341 [Portunus trituberculatus]|uniref:Uncharacterized protein n=1 Tax=Portunus trituberculatus TaxID=210409 RepID=A0A5B7H5T7_PORTR|nr:hypothetical protein [Portunus trituberculatus]
MYKIFNGIEKIDKEDLVLLTEEDRRTRGHAKKIRMRHSSTTYNNHRQNGYKNHTMVKSSKVRYSQAIKNKNDEDKHVV